MFNNRRCCNRVPMDNFNMPYQQVVEPTVNKCVEQVYYHEVPHVVPIHTHVVNKHIYNHTYTPQYTCSQENQVVNMSGCNKGYMNY